MIDEIYEEIKKRNITRLWVTLRNVDISWCCRV